jgi:acetyl-CoA acyltransferase
VDGRLTAEIGPVFPPDGDLVTSDNGIRGDTSLDQMAKLPPIFDRKYGTVTAANASPLTDGGSAVLLMSEERAAALGYAPLAFVRSHAVAAVDPAWQLLMGPAFAVPLALDRAGLALSDMGLIEMHEAFAAQVLSNIQAFESRAFAEQYLARSQPIGEVRRDIVNVMGGSIAIGHPFGATGGRVTLTLANEMKRRDVQFGLISVCAQGGMGFAMVLERV